MRASFIPSQNNTPVVRTVFSKSDEARHLRSKYCLVVLGTFVPATLGHPEVPPGCFNSNNRRILVRECPFASLGFFSSCVSPFTCASTYGWDLGISNHSWEALLALQLFTLYLLAVTPSRPLQWFILLSVYYRPQSRVHHRV